MAVCNLGTTIIDHLVICFIATPVFLFRRISNTYGIEKGTTSEDVVPLCGVVNKFLTNFNDFYDVYLFGMQIDILSMKL